MTLDRAQELLAVQINMAIWAAATIVMQRN